MAEDAWSRTVYFLSAKVLEPQFHGQTKEKLSNRDAVKLVAEMVTDPFAAWMTANEEHGKKICDLVIKQAIERSRSVQKVERKRSSSVVMLPEKLTDCESTDIKDNELFLVEGDSAGGSAKQARDKRFQAIYRMRGKALNSWEVKREVLFSNAEIHDIAVALGVDPHDEKDNPDLSGLRYGKVASMTDADVDGAHIAGAAVDAVLPPLSEADRDRPHLHRVARRSTRWTSPATASGPRRKTLRASTTTS